MPTTFFQMGNGPQGGEHMITPKNKGEAADNDRLRDLGHLSASVGHHVINGFSAVVSNAELIRSRAIAPIDPSELDALGSSMIETALDASQVARRLIDWSRRVTAVDIGQPGREPATVDLNQLIEEVVESEKCCAQSTQELIGLSPWLRSHRSWATPTNFGRCSASSFRTPVKRCRLGRALWRFRRCATLEAGSSLRFETRAVA